MPPASDRSRQRSLRPPQRLPVRRRRRPHRAAAKLPPPNSILSRINGALHGSAPPPATPGEESKHSALSLGVEATALQPNGTIRRGSQSEQQARIGSPARGQDVSSTVRRLVRTQRQPSADCPACAPRTRRRDRRPHVTAGGSLPATSPSATPPIFSCCAVKAKSLDQIQRSARTARCAAGQADEHARGAGCDHAFGEYLSHQS